MGLQISRQKLGVILFFALLIAAGFYVFDDYGIAWDEPLRHKAGDEILGYLIAGEAVPEEVSDDHGVLFELILVGLEKVLSLNDVREIYLLRHLFSHLFFILGVFGFYLLAKYHLENGYLALLGAILLVASPRIYAHSFFNTKDVPFMVLFIFSLYSFVRAFDRRSWQSFVVHGALCGFLTSIRVMGIILVVFTLFFLVLDFGFNRKLKDLLVPAMLFLLVFGVSLISTWPFLWSDPIDRFLTAFRSLSNYTWGRKVLYFGEFHRAYEVPWHYAPVWIAVTTPLGYMAASLFGIGSTTLDGLRNLEASIRQSELRNNLLFLLSFGLPIAGVVLLDSTLYDGWRHLFFIYPSLLMLALVGISKFVSIFEATPAYFLWIPAVLLIISLGSPLVFMIRNHPHQNVYFNILLPRQDEYLRRNWERDYWGVSYRQGLEHVLLTDDSDEIKVSVATHPGPKNADILGASLRERLEFVSNRESADYFITNYRWHPHDYSFGSEVHSIVIQGSKVLSVFKLP